jgi:hypothetical protein
VHRIAPTVKLITIKGWGKAVAALLEAAFALDCSLIT